MTKPSLHNFAVDTDGKSLPYTPAEVNAMVKKAIDDGEILAAIFVVNGDVCVQVFGPPSRQTAALLMQAATGYLQMFTKQS